MLDYYRGTGIRYMILVHRMMQHCGSSKSIILVKKNSQSSPEVYLMLMTCDALKVDEHDNNLFSLLLFLLFDFLLKPIHALLWLVGYWSLLSETNEGALCSCFLNFSAVTSFTVLDHGGTTTSKVLPPSQIIWHSNFLGEPKHLKFDQIYIRR